MRFANPSMLMLLLVLPPALLAFFWWSFRTRQTLMKQFIQARLLPGLVSGVSSRRQKLKSACLLLGVAGLIFALARPQWGFSWEQVNVRGVDIVVAIDTSKSMLAEDIAPNRLQRAKLAALDLMQLAKSDRLGLVAFAGSAFLQCPLTIDDTAFRQSVETLNVNTIPEGGTSLSEAIQTAQSAFKEGENHRILVLMTDGEDQDSGAVEAAKKAAQAGLRIYTIGIGTTAGELLRITDAQGNSDYVRDDQGNVVKSHLNEELLREIAGATEGGFYLPLRGAKTMDQLYEEGLAKLPKSEHQQKLVKQFEERYHWPLACAIVFLIIEVLVPERKREKATAAVALPSGKTKVGAASLLLLLAFLAGNVAASPSSALREYRSGNYEGALKDYEALLEKKSDDPRLHFNAGAAAYRIRKFDEAAKEFNAAIATPDLKLQALAYYNRANAQYWMGEKNADSSKRSEVWQKAIQDYDSSLKLNPQDADAKFNRDLVKKKLEELKQQQQKQNDQKNVQPSEAAKQAKAKADEAVRQRDYTKALDIMQKQLEQDETTAYYSDYINRLKEVTGVQDSAQR